MEISIDDLVKDDIPEPDPSKKKKRGSDIWSTTKKKKKPQPQAYIIPTPIGGALAKPAVPLETPVPKKKKKRRPGF